MEAKYTNIDEYIQQFPETTQILLQKIRILIKEIVSNWEECIAYGIPTIRLKKKNLVHFGGYKTHIGFYPTSLGIEQFKKELEKYEWGKGSIKFPINQEIPYNLIKKIVEFRVKEIL